jgi:hypothetical protein
MMRIKITIHESRAAGVPTLPNTNRAAWELLFHCPVLRATVAPLFSVQGAITEATMNGLIYLVGLVVVILFILSVLGLR